MVMLLTSSFLGLPGTRTERESYEVTSYPHRFLYTAVLTCILSIVPPTVYTTFYFGLLTNEGRHKSDVSVVQLYDMRCSAE